MTTFCCPHCGGMIRFEAHQAGHVGGCPHEGCGGTFIVPDQPTPGVAARTVPCGSTARLRRLLGCLDVRDLLKSPRAKWVASFAVVLAAVLVAGVRYRQFKTNAGREPDATQEAAAVEHETQPPRDHRGKITPVLPLAAANDEEISDSGERVATQEREAPMDEGEAALDQILSTYSQYEIHCIYKEWAARYVRAILEADRRFPLNRSEMFVEEPHDEVNEQVRRKDDLAGFHGVFENDGRFRVQRSETFVEELRRVLDEVNDQVRRKYDLTKFQLDVLRNYVQTPVGSAVPEGRYRYLFSESDRRRIVRLWANSPDRSRQEIISAKTITFAGRTWRLVGPTRDTGDVFRPAMSAATYTTNQHGIRLLELTKGGDSPLSETIYAHIEEGVFARILRIQINSNGRWVSHGETEEWMLDGWRAEMEYANGELHGTQREWYANGQLRIERQWANGEMHGRDRGWYESGKPMYEVTNLDGEDINPRFWREDGTPVD